MASGHWEPRWVEEGYLDYLRYAGDDLIEMHEALLPLDELDLGADGVMVRLTPYRSQVAEGASFIVHATIRNPHNEQADAILRPVLPAGWAAEVDEIRVSLHPGEERVVPVTIRAADVAGRRNRVAVDVTIGSLMLGQHAEAMVDVVPAA
jgi:hypothetical protein